MDEEIPLRKTNRLIRQPYGCHLLRREKAYCILRLYITTFLHLYQLFLGNPTRSRRKNNGLPIDMSKSFSHINGRYAVLFFKYF